MKHNEVKTLSKKNVQYVSIGKKNSLALTTKVFRLCVVFVLCFIVIITLVFDLNPIKTKKSLEAPLNSVHTLPNITREKTFLIDQPGCRIPFLKLYDPSIVRYIGPPTPFQCLGDDFFSRKTQENRIVIDNKLLKIHSYSVDSIKCCYSEFRRRPPIGNQLDIQFEIDPTCTPFKKIKNHLMTPPLLKEEYVKVSCNTRDNITFHEDFFYFIPKEKVKHKRNIFNSSKEHLNVFVTGIDAISRMNLHRQLPKTVEYILSELNAVEMLGYNKIGDNTFPNLMAVTTGQSGTEIENGCLAESKYHRFDNCSLIWKEYNQSGYVTLFAEDATNIGLFNYCKQGFHTLTTDYDYRAFDGVVNYEVGNKNFMNTNVCFGKRLRANILLSYQREFLKTFKTDPFFGLVWSVSLSHDILNLAGILDNLYFKFFTDLKIQNLLNQTALFFISDHGIRWGNMRKTYQGRLEERLPFLFLIMPQWFQQKYSLAWHNFEMNTKKLTTPYDLHETLLDLKDLDNIIDEKIIERTEIMATEPLKRGISLFLPIRPERTCEEAGIDAHWCSCQRLKEIDIKTPIIQNISKFVVSEINSMLKRYRQCATLKLEKITAASMVDYTTLLKVNETKKLVEEYSLMFITNPGGGNFEATVRVTNDDKEPLKLSGSISRINLYGGQSRCISDFHLKLYCYCT